MSVSTADTAELPLVREQEVVVRPSTLLTVPVPEPALAPSGRAALREERRLARRERRLWAFLGLSIMFVTLAITVVVLGMAR
jgi:hypothetical protein